MKLPGRLRGTTLGDVCGALYRAGATGTLELVEERGSAAGRRHAIDFEAGLVSNVETAIPGFRLGEILRTQGFLPEPAARRLLLRLQQRPVRRTGEVLVEDAVVTRELVQAALRHQLRLRIDMLFRLPDARLGFHVLRPRSAPRERPLPLSPHEFLHGRERARTRQPSSPPPAPEPPPDARPRPRTLVSYFDPARRQALQTLGLDEGAERGEVQRAFRLLAREQHPDRFPNALASERATRVRRFAELSAAYHLLIG